MAEPRCEITDLFTDQCDHCRNRSRPRVVIQVGTSAVIAQYPGKCTKCEEWIVPGDLIYPATSGNEEWQGWICSDCLP